MPHYRTRREKQQQQEFDRFANTFLGSSACRAAHSVGKISTEKPGIFLKRASDHIAHLKALDERAAAEEAERNSRNDTKKVPALLQQVLDSQQPDGKWSADDDQLIESIMNNTSYTEAESNKRKQPPPGITLWRWHTALCLSFIRQFPHLYETTADAFELGDCWLGTGTLLDAAKAALPRHPTRDPVRQPVPKPRSESEIASQHAVQVRLEAGKSSEESFRFQQTQKLLHKNAHELMRVARVHQDAADARLGLSEDRTMKSGRIGLIVGAGMLLEQGVPLLQQAASAIRNSNTEKQKRHSILDQRTPINCTTSDTTNREQTKHKDKQTQDLWNNVGHKQALRREWHALGGRKPLHLKPGEFVETCVSRENRMSPMLVTGEWRLARILRYRNSRTLDLELVDDNISPKLGNVRVEHVRALKYGEPEGPAAASELTSNWSKSETYCVKQEKKRLLRFQPRTKPRDEWIVDALNVKKMEEKVVELPSIIDNNNDGLGDSKCHFSAVLLRMHTDLQNNNTSDSGIMTAAAADISNEPTEFPTCSVVKRKRLKIQIANAETAAILSIVDHSDAIRQAKNTLDICSHAYESAQTHSERNRAFDPLTLELTKLRNKACVVVESITNWRKAFSAMTDYGLHPSGPFEYAARELAKGRVGDSEIKNHGPRSFYWNGSNYMLDIATSLDFLAGSKSLKEWYGTEYELMRNPFSCAIALDSRPPTPVSATRTEMVDGKPIQRISASLAQQAEQQNDVLRRALVKVQKTPMWWPQCSEALWFRVRRGEREVLMEEQHHQNTVIQTSGVHR